MYLLPAIDILGGKAVRLMKGDYDRVTVYNDDPVAQARAFAEQGASWLHVVDLDGARSGLPENIAAIEAIVSATGLSVEVGGGVRSLATDIARDGMQTGIDPAAYKAMAEAFGHSVIASGGVAGVSDIEALAPIARHIEGVIAGRAIYEGSLSVEEGVRACAAATEAGSPC